MGIGNLIINVIFNLAYKSSHKDILCCYKVLSKENIKELQLNSKGFSLETELMAKMVNSNYKIHELLIDYKPRTNVQGKKLKASDGIGIIVTIIKEKFVSIIK